MITRSALISWILSVVLLATALGQTTADLIARGDSAHDALEPALALEQYRAAHLSDPQNYEAI